MDLIKWIFILGWAALVGLMIVGIAAEHVAWLWREIVLHGPW